MMKRTDISGAFSSVISMSFFPQQIDSERRLQHSSKEPHSSGNPAT
jgi:hypothetical protein